jgi:cell division protein FtsZ
MFKLADPIPGNAVIKVIGVGGGGGNAIRCMMNPSIQGVQFVDANTDEQVQKDSPADILIRLGESITRGLGAGANPEIGRRAAEEDREKIKEVLMGADMVFITAGMGGGTGTGAAPVFAEVAKELGILTVAVITKPFTFEGRARMQVAEAGIANLIQHVDSLITIPNNKLLSVLGKNVTLVNAFKAANDVLRGAVQGIADLITRPGLINVDFKDVCTVMSEMGMAMIGTGVASGENRARLAAENAIRSPLLEDVDMSGAHGVLVNITGPMDMSIGEFEEVGDTVKNITAEGATIIVGTVIDHELRDEIRVTVIVTGLGRKQIGTARSGDMTKVDGSIDYQHLEKPAVVRKHANIAQSGMSYVPRSTSVQTQQQTQPKPASPVTRDLDYLDIPAFLRRKEELVD